MKKEFKQIKIESEVDELNLEFLVFRETGVKFSSFPIRITVTQYTQGTILHLRFDPTRVEMGIGLERRAS